MHNTAAAGLNAAANFPSRPVDSGWVFACRLWHILLLVRGAIPAVLLAAMAVSEAVIISRIGTISSKFYQAFVDNQRSAVTHLMLWSGGCYAATTLFFTLKSSLQDFLAWRWRAALTLHLQQLYCSNLAFLSLQDIDNPDQRLSQDLPLLTRSLADTLAVLVAAPFNVAWYTQLTHQVFGSWLPVAAAYGFFAVGLLAQRLAMLPVAAAVFDQEAAEGCFRFDQMRFRAWAQEIALYRSAPVEQRHLEGSLSHVLACQARLLLRRAALTAATKLLEYGGLVVNFGCLAAAVFGGGWEADRASPGGLAAKVSVASFYLLTLIYSFTQQQVCSFITARGCWADALDPRTGTAMHGRPGQAYDEVIGAQVLLGYPTQQQQQQQQPGGLRLISHPTAGTQVRAMGTTAAAAAAA
ncbi:hypothetical protein OEZ85_007712 [Tetradesmus obliquus]|uniref:ABC transmembrane type-1 domain-containing protein n=1 Tax=Tetradesmus obliquus TaxID=3088 RepID=A0ABY8TH84_TETOB|nr:hypothetical protein OEZ85_007712 [Tetradesmus obliquus]